MVDFVKMKTLFANISQKMHIIGCGIITGMNVFMTTVLWSVTLLENLIRIMLV